MSNIQLMALGLLIFRTLSSIFIVVVIYKQLQLFRDIVPQELNLFRKVLFVVTVAIFLGNLVPIVFDTAALFVDIGRAQPRPIGIAYAFSNATTALVSALGWLIIYVMAERTDVINKDMKVRK